MHQENTPKRGLAEDKTSNAIGMKPLEVHLPGGFPPNFPAASNDVVGCNLKASPLQQLERLSNSPSLQFGALFCA